MSQRGRCRGFATREPAPPGGMINATVGSESSAAQQSQGHQAAATFLAADLQKKLTVASATGETSSRASELMPILDKKPPCGTTGRAIMLRSNNYTIDFADNGLELFMYRVEIKPGFEGRPLKREERFDIFWNLFVTKQLTVDPYGVVFDGCNMCYSLLRLPPVSTTTNEWHASVETRSLIGDRRIRASVSFMAVGVTRLDFTKNDGNMCQAALTVLDLIFRQQFNMPDSMCANKRFYPTGRSFFNIPTANEKAYLSLDTGREVWSGYFLSAKLGMNMHPILNVDIANSVFYKGQPVMEFMCEILNQATNSNKYQMGQLAQLTTPYYLKPNELMFFTKAIKGLNVACTHLEGDRAHKVRTITLKPASEMAFEWRQKDGGQRTISIAEYYAERYRLHLKYPFFPCIEVGSKNKTSFLPLELCTIKTPQRVTGRLTDTQTATMIKGVCTDAVERERRIKNVLGQAKLDQDPFCRKFGVRINTNMMDVAGRVLPPQSLEYNGGSKITVKDGSWNMGNATFYVGAEITCYCLISFVEKRFQTDLETFCRELMTMAERMGIKSSGHWPKHVVYVRSHEELNQAFSECVRVCNESNSQCDLVVVVMQSKNTQYYATVKNLAEKQYGIMTQCVLQKNVRPPKPQTLSNLLLKINAKLGGINCKLASDIVAQKYVVDCPTLFLGIDVTHPSPADRKSPSIGAATGNVDMMPSKFRASVQVQQKSREAVVYLKDAIQKRVHEFFTEAGQRAERIIVYRDGVAEGQFREVLTEEVKSIRQACQALGGVNYSPKITFIIVQKRHHTRLFCRNERETVGKGKNVPPGTVVDKDITHPFYFDFFLCSHYGIQGTSRPAHYQVLLNENGFTQDELQMITYQLCHLYARCTRTVSIPSPTYYAHLACKRARYHLFDMVGDFGSDITSDSGEKSKREEEDLHRAVVLKDAVAKQMYYC